MRKSFSIVNAVSWGKSISIGEFCFESLEGSDARWVLGPEWAVLQITVCKIQKILHWFRIAIPFYIFCVGDSMMYAQENQPITSYGKIAEDNVNHSPESSCKIWKNDILTSAFMSIDVETFNLWDTRVYHELCWEVLMKETRWKSYPQKLHMTQGQNVLKFVETNRFFLPNQRYLERKWLNSTSSAALEPKLVLVPISISTTHKQMEASNYAGLLPPAACSSFQPVWETMFMFVHSSFNRLSNDTQEGCSLIFLFIHSTERQTSIFYVDRVGANLVQGWTIDNVRSIVEPKGKHFLGYFCRSAIVNQRSDVSLPFPLPSLPRGFGAPLLCLQRWIMHLINHKSILIKVTI